MPQLKVAAYEIEIDATTTPDQALAQMFPANANKMRLKTKLGKMLDSNLPIMDQMVAPLVGPYVCEPSMKPQDLTPTTSVESVLTAQLRSYTMHAPPKTFLLISTGSYLNTKKGVDDAYAQQCPRDVIKWCGKAGLSLLVFLVDPNFGAADAQHQLYHYPPDESGLAFLAGPSSSSSPSHSWVCSTESIEIRTYGTATDFGKSDQLAGVGLPMLGQAFEKAGGCVLVRMFNGEIQYRSESCPPLGTG